MTEIAAPRDQQVTAGQQILPLLEYLARVGRRSADARMSDCLRARHLIALNLLAEHGYADVEEVRSAQESLLFALPHELKKL